MSRNEQGVLRPPFKQAEQDQTLVKWVSALRQQQTLRQVARAGQQKASVSEHRPDLYSASASLSCGPVFTHMGECDA
jgi:hypothetical protein